MTDKNNGELEKEDPRTVEFHCLKLKQPLGDIYVGSIGWRQLCDISYFDVRRVLQEKRDVERYLGIQRPLNDRRVTELEKYVNFYDATFPTSIILSVDEKCAEYDEKTHTMKLSNFPSEDGNERVLFRHIARVLDGQHRIAGLFGFVGENFDLSVSLFVGADIADQAQVFSTVNLEQTKVQKSLAYDLFALAKSRSPQRTCHNIAVALDQDNSSPFFERIKRLGVATPDRTGETITQATFVESVQVYITRDPRTDRDLLLRGRKLPRATEDELQRLPLRNMFIDERDLDIASLVWNYFDAARTRWPTAWAFRGRGLMLNKTNGFRGLMRVFGPAYLWLAAPGDIVESEEFFALFEKTGIDDDAFTTENFPPGTSGEAGLARELIEQMGVS